MFTYYYTYHAKSNKAYHTRRLSVVHPISDLPEYYLTLLLYEIVHSLMPRCLSRGRTNRIMVSNLLIKNKLCIFTAKFMSSFLNQEFASLFSMLRQNEISK